MMVVIQNFRGFGQIRLIALGEGVYRFGSDYLELPNKLGFDAASYQIERDEAIGKVATRNDLSVRMVTVGCRDMVESPNDVSAFWGLIYDGVEGISLSGELLVRHHVSWPTDAELKQLISELALAQLVRYGAHRALPFAKGGIPRGIKLSKNGHWRRMKV